MIQRFADGIGDPLLLLDQLFGSLSAYFVFTFDYTQSVGFTAVIRGGRYSGSTYADTTLTLASSSTNYVEADTTAHTIISNTSGYTGGTKTRIGIATTNANGLTTWVQDFTVGGTSGGSAPSPSPAPGPSPGPAPAPTPTFTRDWTDNTTTNQTLFGAASPTQAATGGVYQLKTNGAATAASRFDASPSVTDCDATVMVSAFAAERSGLIYRTPSGVFSSANFGFGYSAAVTNNQVFLMYGSTFVQAVDFPTPFADGTVVTLRVVATGTEHKVYVNGTLYIDATDTSYTGAGVFGLWSLVSGAFSTFDNFAASGS